MKMLEKLVKDYNLSLVLAAMFLISWLGQAVFQWEEFVQHQQEHNQPVESSAFVPEFLSRTFENWQSEFLQLLTMVVLTSFLIHKGSSESRDGDDEMKASLARIENMLKKRK